MAKEPWQEDIYDNQEETRTERRKREQGGGVLANRILTILCKYFLCDCSRDDYCSYLSFIGWE